MAAQGGIAGHVTVGDGAVLGGRSGVIADLERNQTYFGYPARTMKEWAPAGLRQRRSRSSIQRIAELEEKLAALEARMANSEDRQD